MPLSNSPSQLQTAGGSDDQGVDSSQIISLKSLVRRKNRNKQVSQDRVIHDIVSRTNQSVMSDNYGTN